MRSASMLRPSTTTTAPAAATGLVWACTMPAKACGCPPARSSVAIVGTLRDALDAPLDNRVFAFEATQEAHPTVQFAEPTDVRTDATGAFSARVYSLFSPGVHSVVARITRTPENDTMRILVGSASFKYERQTPDTIRVALRIP